MIIFGKPKTNTPMSKEKILSTLQNSEKPLRPGDIAKEIGVDSKEVSKFIKELKAEDKVFSPKRCFYSAK